MVNPRSELFETHPDWAIWQPKRALELQRNQLILDLSRPEVKEYVFEVADRVLRANPDISYIKWDCNRYVTQPGSPYLSAEKQSHLWIDYVNALYDIFECLAKAHPSVQIMMCSGGGGRVDYGALRFAHEYWPSDRTDAARRVFIQWGFSYFLPAIASAAHVTHMGHRPLKFSFDVAMSGRLGMDMEVDQLPPEDREFAKRAICTYKGIRDIVQLGDLYRLESPYAGTRTSLLYYHEGQAVMFVYSLGESEPGSLQLPLPPGRYQITELNTDLPGPKRELTAPTVAIPALGEFESRVYLITG
jgi:alpha-galactosidase